MQSQPPITDSPWLWFAIFPAVGLVAILATGGKFGDRQANIERQGQARTAVAEGSLDINEDSTGRKSSSGVPHYSQPGETQVKLWPLVVTLSVITLASLGMLVRERLFSRSAIAEQDSAERRG
ncbi:hypothetical protein [Bythopirellula polymerisocia]|uniref:Uncharacterized protein n=1 Tax=Bythopirellula polymerisocia TaxID=2528003 RepID=A0A5C6CHP7_9BACT|nr:hypothetical protein [Bythopirellula polymerisocia]TWU23732.1 hypothetical protein Pla144_39070 [Bythopirellula polymerisocia]